jgi:hypothetical protein
MSYTGLIPSTYASAKRLTHGPLTKQGNKSLRWAFTEAVTPAIRTSPFLRRYSSDCAFGNLPPSDDSPESQNACNMETSEREGNPEDH